MAQNGNSDKIQQLIEAARAEERAKLAVEVLLRRIDERLTAIEQALHELEVQASRARGGIDANYININTVLQFLAAIWQGDKSMLSSIQQRLAEQAFTMQEREEGGISVQATGDVNLSADKVGRDKREEKDDKEA